MKNQSETLFYFSGYPLAVVHEKPPAKIKKPDLFIVREEPEKKLIKNDPANNPGNWDTGWFVNYE